MSSRASSRSSQHPSSMETTSFSSMSSVSFQPVYKPQHPYQPLSVPDQTYHFEGKCIDAMDAQLARRPRTPEAAPSPVPPYFPKEKVREEVFSSAVPQYVLGEEHNSAYIHVPRRLPQSPSLPQQVHSPLPETVLASNIPSQRTRSPAPENRPFSPPKVEWDASR